MDLFEAIRKRQSIRRYKPDAVSDEDINTVLEAARLAPSWHNYQCWRFVVVRDPEIKAKLAEAIGQANSALNTINQAPVVIVACAQVGKSGRIRGELVSDKGEWWYMFDVGLAMENLCLAAYTLGLGTLHVGWFDAKKAAEILKVPEGTVVVELMPLGYPEGEAISPARKELKDIVFYDTYENPKSN